MVDARSSPEGELLAMSPRDPGLAAALARIRDAPAGPAVLAVFQSAAVLAGAEAHEPDAVRARVAAWAGRPGDELLADGAHAFRRGEAAGLRYEVWDLVNAHRRRGHTLVLLSPLTADRAGPIARELGIEDVLCSEAETRDGDLTGRFARSLLTPAERSQAVAEFAAERGADLATAFAYAADATDAGVLDRVGTALAVDPDERLRAAAADRGWPVVDTFDRSAGPVGVARTIAVYGAFLTATGVGLAAGLRVRRRRPGVDAMTRTFARLGPAVSGIRINAQGEEHTRSHRPAVFLINHQSHLVDAIVSFHLLRDGFTPVAKKEVRAIPAIGQATWLADWAYVDRVGDRSKARAATRDAVEKLEQGVSVILAPEGTRSVGPQVGPFKKGAFYMAREAGVPVVPIVMRNTGELMWRNGKALKAGVVDVVVHPPIFCDWTDDELDERVAEVRQLYVDTLAGWPAATGREG